jgi:hypothetical protein
MLAIPSVRSSERAEPKPTSRHSFSTSPREAKGSIELAC